MTPRPVAAGTSDLLKAVTPTAYSRAWNCPMFALHYMSGVQSNLCSSEAYTVYHSVMSFSQQFLDYILITAAFRTIVSGLPAPLNHIRKYSYHPL